jgi:hypothetical protein
MNIIHYGVNSHKNPTLAAARFSKKVVTPSRKASVAVQLTNPTLPRSSWASKAPLDQRLDTSSGLQRAASHAIFLLRPPCAADDLDYHKPKMNYIQYGIEHGRMKMTSRRSARH